MYAGFWKRFIACIIDSCILYIPLIGVFMVVMLFVISTDPKQESVGSMLFSVSFNLIIILAPLIYWTLFEASSYQATPGKRIVGIKVTDENGNRLTFIRSFCRNLDKLISNMTMNIGYVMAGFTVRRQALHDKMAGCLVVDKNAVPQTLAPLPEASLGQIFLAVLGAVSPFILFLLAGIFFVIVLGALTNMPEAANAVNAIK